ncbi:MAG: nitrite reductase large subunit NirB [Actinomycetota bacterium]
MPQQPTLVIVGNGPVGHRLIEALADRGATADWRIVVFGEEPRPAYDRVGLSSFFGGRSADDLSLVAPGFYEQHEVDLRLSEPATSIDRVNKTVTGKSRVVVAYDHLVLATGSRPFVPPIGGSRSTGSFVYRTIEDLQEILGYADNVEVGAVVGGGLLGLEAARALKALGLETHVIDVAPRLMALQVDPNGGRSLRRRIEAQGVIVHTAAKIEHLETVDGRVTGVALHGEFVPAELVVFAAGIRPRDELGRDCGLGFGERGGILVDRRCVTEDPAISAIGECAAIGGRVYGLVGPGYTMADIVADRLCGGHASFEDPDMSTKLKLLGVDVASFGDALATGNVSEVTYVDDVDHVYRKLVLSADGKKLLGGVLVGDASAYDVLRATCASGGTLPAKPAEMVVPASGGEGWLGAGALVDEALICSCNTVTKGQIAAAVAAGNHDVPALKKCTKAGTGCGSCVPLMAHLLKSELAKSGIEVSDRLCEHFDYSRQELFDIVRVQGIRSFQTLLADYGTGRGCEICRPATASIFASLSSGHILDGEHGALQDTNDHFLANLQRDGTYSVVPRIPGGEITPERLIVIGEVARDFGLYTKITGGQRIDLFGARVEQLPAIWRRLVDAGLESGHAYGKALRTVKSCVGQNWCRYGVQDSTTLAIDLEMRYRGLRAPHKIKMAVSGCARECAEAQGKDVGIIATEKGWNLYVGGNGGMVPQHAKLLATDLDSDTLIRYIDRFLMFYIRTGERLERTATWLNRQEGGLDYVKAVVCDDSLGLGADLDAEMERHVAGYRDEWAETLEDPERLKRFVTFVNAPDEPDRDVVFVLERGQPRPARDGEKVLMQIGSRP